MPLIQKRRIFRQQAEVLSETSVMGSLPEARLAAASGQELRAGLYDAEYTEIIHCGQMTEAGCTYQ